MELRVTAAPPLDDTELDDSSLDEMFAALANSTRRAMLVRLAEGEATVNELAAPFTMSLPAISRHVRVLERAGLITQSQNAQYRPCQINPAAIRQVRSWTEYYRPLWDSRFDQLDEYLKKAETDHD